jgi:hypothetical protein
MATGFQFQAEKKQNYRIKIKTQGTYDKMAVLRIS